MRFSSRHRPPLLGLLLGLMMSASLGATRLLPAGRLIQWPPRAASPTFDLVDERGRTRAPGDYRGRVFVVLFGFARCPDVCPAELFKLSSALKPLPGAGKDVQVLFITLDPAHDSGEVLQGYVKTFNPSFQGLTGSAAQIGAAAGSFHVNYAPVQTRGDDTIGHSSSVFLFDIHGHLRWIGTADTSTREYTRGLATLLAEAS